MTVYRSHATMVCVKTASPPSPVSATRDTQAPSAISRSRSATATRARTEDAALTWSMPTSVTAHQEPQVGSSRATKFIFCTVRQINSHLFFKVSFDMRHIVMQDPSGVGQMYCDEILKNISKIVVAATSFAGF